MKNLTTIILLMFVAVTVVYLVIGNRGAAPDRPRETATSPPEGIPVSSEPITESDATDRVEHDRTNDPPAPGTETETEPKANTPTNHKVIAYYFHRTQRCHTCLTMEAYIQQTLKDAFSNALETGELEWRPVNVEEPQNEHFVKEYELYASALVIVDVENGQAKRSKKLEQIWGLVGDEQKFKTFVRDEARAYLEATPDE